MEKECALLKTAMWLYLFLFLAIFDLHAQYPILTAYAISLGAAPTFIGWMMGMYSLTHLPGNIIAGNHIDRHGSRPYIVFSLIAAGTLLLFQAHISMPWQLLIIRALSGFVLAFLSPACLTLLSQLSTDPVTQGKYMSGHGVIHTLASVVSPAAGALIVTRLGYCCAFESLGVLLIITGCMAWASLPRKNTFAVYPTLCKDDAILTKKNMITLRHFMLPLCISCAQGILYFELPLSKQGQTSIMSTGILFSIMSAGALTTLSLLFLNRYCPQLRVATGVLGMALCFFILAAAPTTSINYTLFVLGMTKGLTFPALSILFILLSQGDRLGRLFSLQSIAVSVGAFIGPITAAQLRAHICPYFLAFVLLMIGLAAMPIGQKIMPHHLN